MDWAANSLAEESKRISSSRYPTTSVGSISVGGRSAASVGVQQSNPKRRYEGFS